MPVRQNPGGDAPLVLHAKCAFAGLTGPVGVAVSGGSDSMAMLHLMVRAGVQAHAVTVDHHLRPEAGAEAALVARVCEGLGVPHQVLHWDHGPVPGNLMQAARQARYGLIAAWAAGQGIGQVAVGHTADDQAETFLMGLSLAAGLDGLSGMRPRWAHGGVVFVRPFLNCTRADLRGYLARHSLPWVDDPTNENAAYTRIKARRALDALKPLGITVGRLAASVQHLAMAQRAIDHTVAQAATDILRETAGALFLDAAKLRLLQPELSRRLLIAGLLWVSGANYPPRAPALARLTAAMEAGRDATLSGCRIKCLGQEILITREPRAVAMATGTPWDGRWHVTGPAAETRALGAKGLAMIKDWRATGLPRAVLEVTPALWQGNTLIAAPSAGFGAPATATVQPTFGSFLLSH